ncbi:hypothetical protein GBAR_LOCUS26475 [Geodia barretti]|uniref:Uncharacterized protein n=1 Tax=Geodia barretti TaxID=519541 RepID=A0AA35TGG1_GEOBA|nr:hypothetical protein GBAR_LOCUS26475 [Geodia barretti]
MQAEASNYSWKKRLLKILMCVCFSVPKALRTEVTKEVKGKKVRPSSTAVRRGGGRRKKNKVRIDPLKTFTSKPTKVPRTSRGK